MEWINSELVVDEHDVVWSLSGTMPEGVWVGGNFSRGPTDPEFPFRRLIDNVEIAVHGEVPEIG